jgi:adenylosuccinate lyase
MSTPTDPSSGAALSTTATALGKVAVDVQVLARTEVGEVAGAGGAGRGGSSAMPQKRNPGCRPSCAAPPCRSRC